MRQDRRRDLQNQARDARVLEGKFARYLVNNLYDRQGRSKPWKKPVRCLCKGKDVLYVHGHKVPCGRYKCQQYVSKLRRSILEGSELMTERKRNLQYWKNLDDVSEIRAKVYAKQYGISVMQAKWQLAWNDVLAEEDRQFLIEEGLRYDKKAHYSRSEEE